MVGNNHSCCHGAGGRAARTSGGRERRQNDNGPPPRASHRRRCLQRTEDGTSQGENAPFVKWHGRGGGRTGRRLALNDVGQGEGGKPEEEQAVPVEERSVLENGIHDASPLRGCRK